MMNIGRKTLEATVDCGPDTRTKNTRRRKMALFTPSDGKQPNQNGKYLQEVHCW